MEFTLLLKHLASTLALLTATLAAAPVSAATTVLLSENFNAENGGVGAAEYSGFAQFVAANVDLLAPGYFFSLCQSAGHNSPCVDMEGSGNGSLSTRTFYDIAPGTVTLQFDLAGDQRGHDNNGVTVALTGLLGNTLFSENFSLPGSTGFTTFTRAIDVAAPVQARLSFLSSGPADSFGMLLDNVVLIAGDTVVNTPAVPEPETYALMLAGLGALGIAARRRRR